MSSYIDFFFDVISPYSYIAHKKIQNIKENQKITFNYKPILLGGLHNLAGISAPAFNKYKMKNMQSDCELVSRKNSISFKWNLKFPINSLLIMRGYLSLDGNQKEKYLDIFFDAYWKDNLDLSSEDEVLKLLEVLNIDSKAFLKKINQQSIKDDLKRLTSDAFEKEVFGAPTFIVNNKIFWGQDRLEYALEELN
ncbi:2-hydroxychromene-2-carboxylate isomerase [Candidatus Pelagibacter sp.]|nr:2-hydroxychromene-2-carboxylate isomerase [Candidatus Pelagibacter sp.]MDB4811686.1 2-hydroxychromene-2-carboxylate isomerase [Candidatus Pelagibacter sp.]MDC0465449.1 2-hydroxychromene-2-carboxylate isomerase [Candidatus Pelagibacter sp.]|tara:strand:- start:9 stop:590 length:582 start_codon:yes stop_codon:yes gene_type:complete